MKFTFKSGQSATYVLQDYYGGALERLDGFVTGTANAQYFIHIFDGNSVPVNGNAPKRSLQVLGQDGFRFDFSSEDLEFKLGICFALSSSEETYTAVVDGAKVDWEGEIDTQAQRDSTVVSTAGDLTTNRKNLVVLAEASGPLGLLEVDWISNTGGVAYLMLFAKDAPSNGDTPILQLGKLDTTSLSNLSANYRFGKGALNPLSKDASGAHAGCNLQVSSTTGTLTLTGASTEKLRARYKVSVP